MSGLSHRSQDLSGSRLRIFLFMAWRNLWRYPVRSLLTVCALSGGLAMVIFNASLMTGMTRQMVVYATEVSTGHIQVHRQAFADDQDLYATLPWPWLEEIEADFPNLKVAPRLYAAGLASTADTSTGVMIRGVDAERELAVTRMLRQVRQGEVDLGIIDQTPQGIARYGIAVGTQLARNMRIAPGDELVLVTQAADGSIGNALFVVTAVLTPMELNFDRMGVVMSREAYQQLMFLEDGFHELAILMDNLDQLETTRLALQARLTELAKQNPLDEWGGSIEVRTWKELNPAVSEMLAVSSSMTLIIGLIIVALASLGMLNTMLMAVHERTREFGILMAIGMKKVWILVMVLLEALCLSLLSAVIGALLGSWLGLRMEETGIDFSDMMPDGYDWGGLIFEPVMKGYLEPTHVLYASVMMIMVALLASLIPSWRSIRLKPVEAMR